MSSNTAAEAQDEAQPPVAAFPSRALIFADTVFPDAHGGGLPTNFDLEPFDTALWYHSCAEVLRDFGIATSARAFPSPHAPQSDKWCAQARSMNLDAETLLVCHGFGASCALRVLADDPALKVGGLLLIGAAHDDPTDENVRSAGFVDSPVDLQHVASQCGWLAVIASTGDPYYPIEEQAKLAAGLGVEVCRLPDDGFHFETTQEAVDGGLLDEIRGLLGVVYGEPRPRPEHDGSPDAGGVEYEEPLAPRGAADDDVPPVVEAAADASARENAASSAEVFVDNSSKKADGCMCIVA